jgi:hypothetical protein
MNIALLISCLMLPAAQSARSESAEGYDHQRRAALPVRYLVTSDGFYSWRAPLRKGFRMTSQIRYDITITYLPSDGSGLTPVLVCISDVEVFDPSRRTPFARRSQFIGPFDRECFRASAAFVLAGCEFNAWLSEDGVPMFVEAPSDDTARVLTEGVHGGVPLREVSMLLSMRSAESLARIVNNVTLLPTDRAIGSGAPVSAAANEGTLRDMTSARTLECSPPLEHARGLLRMRATASGDLSHGASGDWTWHREVFFDPGRRIPVFSLQHSSSFGAGGSGAVFERHRTSRVIAIDPATDPDGVVPR